MYIHCFHQKPAAGAKFVDFLTSRTSFSKGFLPNLASNPENFPPPAEVSLPKKTLRKRATKKAPLQRNRGYWRGGFLIGGGAFLVGILLIATFFSEHKTPKGVFFAHNTVEIVRMTIMNSVRGLETSLEVFPDTLASFTHPGNTQRQVFDIPDHVPYYDLVRDLVHKKKRLVLVH